MKFLPSTLIVLLSLIGMPNISWAQGACMVSDLEEQVTIFHGKDQPLPANKFKKLWPGDQLEISKDSKLQLNYLALGKIETWKGPVRIIIEDNGARDQNNVQNPTITFLDIQTTYLKDSKLLNQQHTAGQVTIRGTRTPQLEDAPLGPQGKEEFQSLQIQYHDLLKRTKKGEVTADMFYLAGLEKLGQKGTMATHIQKLLTTNGSNVDLEGMLDEL